MIFTMRRTGRRKSITDDSAKGTASDKGGKPDFRIGGRISDDFDDVDDGVV